jgi:flagellum-specific peptidoglycan hydrolase FlgJ
MALKPLEPPKAAWLLTMEAAVEKELPQLKPSARALLLAHAALESGWGGARAWRRGFNFGNITAGKAWQGAKWTDVGGDVDGKGNPITQVWRAYSTVEDAIADYWDFLGPNQNRGRYVKARACLEQGDAINFALELHKAGYYELAAPEYARRLGVVLQIVLKELS